MGRQARKDRAVHFLPPRYGFSLVDASRIEGLPILLLLVEELSVLTTDPPMVVTLVLFTPHNFNTQLTHQVKT